MSPSAIPSTTLLEQVFPGDGEMARLMRAKDWSRTPLGPVESWPQSLRTSVSILLKTRHPMLLLWSGELVQFYNDGFRPSLGAHKHPEALGQRGRECWDEIWPIIGPQFESVMERGEETWHEDQLVPFDRNGFLEEIYFTYSYSPIHDESGGVGGTLVVCTETTKRVLGERRLRTLRDLSSAASDAQRVAAATAAALAVLAENPEDFPFALLYLVSGDTSEACLAGTAGIPRGGELAPETVDLAAGRTPWPLAEVLARGKAVELRDLGAHFGELPARPWPEIPHTALALPVAAPGQAGATGVLVTAVSPRLALDESYRGFLELATVQIAGGIASARAYEEERRRAEVLAELDRAKTDFFSNVSHEFRTPLTLILGPLEEALAAAVPKLEGERLETAHRNALRLLRLVNHLLDFSRIEAGRYQASYEPVDLAAYTAELASAFRSLVESAGLRYVVDCPALDEEVFVDPEAWEKVVLNLISNAFKFTLEGEIEVRLEGRGDEVELRVTDTGTGIPATELPHVFERFHRVRDARARTQEGSGIGLALVRELVTRHGGTIDVDSTAGLGTTFRVRLPTGSAHLPAERLSTAGASERLAAKRALSFVEEASRWLPDVVPNELDLAGKDLAGKEPATARETDARVLLVDDNSDMRAYLSRLLGVDWEVVAVADGAAALERIRAESFDLVVSDVMMPRMDGLELLRELRADPATSALPVILLSARAGEEKLVEGLAGGADDYVVKPFAARELVARARSQLAMSRLRAATEMYRRQIHEIFLKAPAAISILRGPRLVYELANEKVRELTAGREILGKPLREALPEIESQPLIELVEQVYTTGEPYVGEEFRIDLDRTGTGRLETGFFTFVLQPIHGVDGRVEGVASFGFEVTELVKSRQKMADLAEKARLETERKDEFLAMLGHELRNPLAPIGNALEVLRAEPENGDAERRRWAVDVMSRQLKQMAGLVDDLLDVARITRGTVKLRKKRIALAEILDSAIETVKPLADERGMTLEVAVPSETIWLHADPVRLAQVVANLLNNAVKYGEEGGHVWLSAGCDGEKCTIEVVDDGIGIAAENLPHVFDLFSQVVPTLDRPRGGLGIGLTVVRRLVELHGGRVIAESGGTGKGSRFVVTLPVLRGDARLRATASERPAAATHRRVLVVDDNRDAADSLAMLLEIQGHETTTAFDGEAAIEAALEFRPDVVLLDIGLPKMDGFEVAARLRRDLGDAPLLIALTGYGRAVDRERSRQVGFDHHLLKPVDVKVLQRLLEPPAGDREPSPV